MDTDAIFLTLILFISFFMCVMGIQEARKYHFAQAFQANRRVKLAQILIVKRITNFISLPDDQNVSNPNLDLRDAIDIEMQSHSDRNGAITILSDEDHIALKAGLLVPNGDNNICNICLMDFQVGDDVAWSNNQGCLHGFHKDCIIEWLLIRNQCPVCRGEYVSLKDEEQIANI